MRRRLQNISNSPLTSVPVHVHPQACTSHFSYCSQHIPEKGKKELQIRYCTRMLIIRMLFLYFEKKKKFINVQDIKNGNTLFGFQSVFFNILNDFFSVFKVRFSNSEAKHFLNRLFQPNEGRFDHQHPPFRSAVLNQLLTIFPLLDKG